MKIGFVLTLTFVLSITVNFFSFSKTVFLDDFEKDTVGQSPSKWVGCPEEGTVAKDPKEQKNQVMLLNETSADCAIVADTDDLEEYFAEWDWLWEDGARCHSMAVHWQKKGEFYHFSRRTDGSSWGIGARSGGAWPGAFVMGNSPYELNKWYRLQVSVNGPEIVGKMKERDDKTPFDKIEPFIEMHGEDKRFQKGKFGPNEGWGAAFMDNVLIYIGEPSRAVKQEGKLTTTWGEIKVGE